MIKTIIFDFAGVLTTEGFRKGLIRKLKERYDFDGELFNERFLEHEVLYMAGKMPVEDFWSKLCLGFNIPLNYFIYSFQNCYELNEGVVEVIKSLKGHYKIVLFSDNFDVLSPVIKQDARIIQLFDEMYFSDEMGLIKKQPGSFELLFNLLKENPSDCVFIDDKEHNLRPAKDLGCKVILFNGTEDFKKELMSVLN